MEHATAAVALALLSSLLLSGCLGTDFCLGIGFDGCPRYAPPPPWMNEACRNAGGHWEAEKEFVSCCTGPPHCVYANGTWIDLHIYEPTPTPTTQATATPAHTVTSTPTPSQTPTPASAHPCESITRNRLYSLYHPTYCTGTPCTPLSEEEVKAKISIDFRQSPTIGFTYQQGNQCSIITYSGRAWIVEDRCELHDPVITDQQTVPVPC